MSFLQTQTTSFKKELYEAVHNLPVDVIKIALYTANASLNEATTVYSTADEVVGPGYVAGGVVMTGVTVNASGYTAYVDFADATWAGASFTARGALIYNSSKANRSIAVLDFGADKTASGSFVIQMPANSPTTALIRSSN